MTYQALYRSWRPQTFSDVVGQPHVKQTLMNAVQSGRVAHAYLFCGPRGTGKTSTAKILAKAVNCLHPDGAEPCNDCSACTSIQAGANVDVEEIDAASNRGVDEIRQLRDKVQYAPASLRRKVYIVDEVHMLTAEAFNALLKTLEEPPAHALFVLATTEPHKIPGTIVSRCQRFDFRRISSEQMVERMKLVCREQGWEAEDEALWKIAVTADGGLRDALSLLEQTAAFGQGRVTAVAAAHVVGGVETSALLALLEKLAHGELLVAMRMLGEWYAAGRDATRIVQELLQVARDVFVVKLSSGAPAEPGQPLHEGLAWSGSGPQASFRRVADACSSSWLLEVVRQLGETYQQLRFLDQPRLALEAALVKLAAAPGEAERRQPGAAGSRPADGAVVRPDSAAPSAGAEHAGVPARPREAEGPGVAGFGSGTAAGPASAGAAPPGRPGPAARRGTSARRKMDVLQELARQAQEHRLQQVVSVWPNVLQAVRNQRIQTYAWLTNGKPVLATDDALVVAFSSALHREAVMKPEERSLIEAALAEAAGAPMRMLALLQSDWDAFRAASEAPAESSRPVDLAEQAARLFGPERVEIEDEE